jgi:hypothetical protein
MPQGRRSRVADGLRRTAGIPRPCHLDPRSRTATSSRDHGTLPRLPGPPQLYSGSAPHTADAAIAKRVSLRRGRSHRQRHTAATAAVMPPPVITHDRSRRSQRVKAVDVLRLHRSVPSASRSRECERRPTPIRGAPDFRLTFDADDVVQPDTLNPNTTRHDHHPVGVPLTRNSVGVYSDDAKRHVRLPCGRVKHQVVELCQVKPVAVITTHEGPRRRHAIARPDDQIGRSHRPHPLSATPRR